MALAPPVEAVVPLEALVPASAGKADLKSLVLVKDRVKAVIVSPSRIIASRSLSIGTVCFRSSTGEFQVPGSLTVCCGIDNHRVVNEAGPRLNLVQHSGIFKWACQ